MQKIKKKKKIIKTRLHTGCGMCKQDCTVHTALHSLPIAHSTTQLAPPHTN